MADDNEMQAKITADNEDLKQKAKESAEAIKQMAAQMKEVEKNLDSLREKIVEAFSFAAIVEFTEHFAKLGDQALEMAAQLGTTVEAVTELQTAYKIMGIEGGLSARQLIVLQRDLSLAATNSSSVQAKALSNLGVNMDEVKSKLNDGKALLEIMRKAWQDNADGANKLANFQRIFGLSLAQNIPYLLKTDEEVAKVNETAKEMGTIFGERTAKAMSDSGEKLNTFWTSTRGLGESIFMVLKPALDLFFTTLTDIVLWLRSGSEAIANFINYSPDVVNLSSAFTTLWQQIVKFDQTMVELMGTFDAGALLNFTGFLADVSTMARDTAKEIAWITAAVKDLGAWLTRVKEESKENKLFETSSEKKEIDDLTTKIELLKGQRELAAQADLITHKNTAAEIEKVIKESQDRIEILSKLHVDRLEAIRKKQLDDEKKAWDDYGQYVLGILDSIEAANTANHHPKEKPEGKKDDGKRQPPGITTGGGGKHHPAPEFMKEWKEALQQQQIDNNDFFDKAKQTEQAYWESKLAFVQSNLKQITAQYIASGQTQEQAARSVRDLQFGLESQIFELKKANANKAIEEAKKALDRDLANFKEQLDAKQISESEWYEKSRAAHATYSAFLESQGAKDTEKWKDELRQRDKLDADHLKNASKVWVDAFNYIDQQINTMLNGVLQGTQTWEKAMQNFFKNMAISFITQIAQMTIKWLAFKALMTLSGGTVNIGNPFNALSGIGSAIGGLVGGGGAGGGAAGGGASSSEKQLTTAVNAGTAATKTLATATGNNTIGTIANTGGILQQIVGAVQWIAGMLGLTTTTTAQVGTNISLEASNIALAAEMVGLQFAIEALTIVMATKPPGLATGAWSIPNDMHAIVHKGEMIIPAAHAEALRSGAGLNYGSNGSSGPSTPVGGGGGGGGGTIAVTINAMDSRSLQTFLQANPQSLARAMGVIGRNGSTQVATAAGQGRRF